MSIPTFNAKITISASIPAGITGAYDIEFSIFDYEGIFDGTAIQVGDHIFLDTGNYAPGTITRYRISDVFVLNTLTASCRIEFFDNTSEIDPIYAAGIDGFICRPSTNKGLAILPSPSTQLLPEKFNVYVKNFEYNGVFDILSLPQAGGTMTGDIDMGNDNGVILTSPGGYRFRVKIDDDGALTVTPL